MSSFIDSMVSPFVYSLPLAGNSLRVIKVEREFRKGSSEQKLDVNQITDKLWYTSVSRIIILGVKAFLWMLYFFTFLNPNTMLMGIFIDILLEVYCLKILHKMKKSKEILC